MIGLGVSTIGNSSNNEGPMGNSSVVTGNYKKNHLIFNSLNYLFI